MIDDAQLDDSAVNKVRRGRPVRVEPAMTHAQRQAAYRQRLKASGRAFLNVDVDREVLQRLHEFVEFKDMTLGEVVSKVLRDRLIRKR